MSTTFRLQAFILMSTVYLNDLSGAVIKGIEAFREDLLIKRLDEYSKIQMSEEAMFTSCLLAEALRIWNRRDISTSAILYDIIVINPGTSLRRPNVPIFTSAFSSACIGLAHWESQGNQDVGCHICH